MPSKFRIKVPGDLDKGIWGQNYFALDKKGHLNIVGEKSNPNVLKRYEFRFCEESAVKHGIGQLLREYEVNPSD